MILFAHHTQGACGGGWHGMCVNNHPAGLAILGEAHKPGQLDFAHRGLEKSDYVDEILKFFDDMEHYGFAGAGVIRGGQRDEIQSRILQSEGRNVQVLRNPLHKLGVRTRNMGKRRSVIPFWEAKYDRTPQTWDELFEAHVEWVADTFHGRFLRRRKRNGWPIVRLEDLNDCMQRKGGYFKRYMEWWTQVEWPQAYIQHIQEFWLPKLRYPFQVAWEYDDQLKRNRVRRVRTWAEDRGPSRVVRSGWEPDPEPAWWWEKWPKKWRRVYKLYFGDIERQLGYNQESPGSVSRNWVGQNPPWGRM